MTGLLAEMAVSSRERLGRALEAESFSEVRARALGKPAAPPLKLGAFDLLAEVKLQAPSAGLLAVPLDAAGFAAEQAVTYAEAGAAAVSVLTEPSRFAGAIQHLASAAQACPVPVMRKDFLVDPFQVWEARAAGAGGVLLIARMLDDGMLRAMLDAAAETGLFALVEAFDEADLDRIGPLVPDWRGSQPLLVGVNCRDLQTLAIDFERLLSLADRIPAGAVPVAESGVATEADVRAVATAGYRVVLVGTALMTAPDPGALARNLLAAGRGKGVG